MEEAALYDLIEIQGSDDVQNKVVLLSVVYEL